MFSNRYVSVVSTLLIDFLSLSVDSRFSSLCSFSINQTLLLFSDFSDLECRRLEAQSSE